MGVRSTIVRLGQLAVAASLTLTPALAQTTGSVHGAVADESGAALPGVTLTISGVGAPQIAISNARGAYRFLNLDPGSYQMQARLDGYSIVEQPNVVIDLNRSASIHFTLTSAVRNTVTVTAETPLLDPRSVSVGALVPLHELETIPSVRDPWGLATQAPNVQSDAPNVGGDKSGSQRQLFAPGNHYRDNDFQIDGIQITDTTQTGASTTFFDFEQFEAVEIATGGPDVTKHTPGVTLNMVTRRGTNEFRGTARFLLARNNGLGFLGASSSGFECADLDADQDCDAFTPSRVDSIAEYGFQAGGPVLVDRLWLWGSFGVQDIHLVEAGGDEQPALIENQSVKLNAQLSPANSGVASWNNGNKTNTNRGSKFATPEARFDTRGPSAYWRLEDTHLFGSNLYLTSSYQKSDLGFQFKPRSGCLDSNCPLESETLFDSDGIRKHNFLNGYSRRPEDAIKVDGSYFFTVGDLAHELKFGGRLRESAHSANAAWPGRNIAHLAGENFGVSPGPVDFFFLYRGANDLQIDVDYNSLWVQDTLAAGEWTINLGARYDLQTGTNQPGTTGQSVQPDVFPEISFSEPVDAGFEWETVSPRLGVTYAAGEGRDTLLRASFSQFPRALGAFDVAWLNPALPTGYGAYAYFRFIDEDGDNKWNSFETASFLFGLGYDPKNPTSNLNTVDPGLDPELTSELLLGVEHAFLPELVVGLSYTWRQIEDGLLERRLVRPAGTSGPGRPETSADYVADGTARAELPDGSLPEVEVFALDPSLEDTGFRHLQNDTRSREFNGLTLTLNKRLTNRWSLRGYARWGETEWDVPRSHLDLTDPSPEADGSDHDGALYSVRISSKGRGERYVQASWQANLAGIYQFAPDRPWGFVAAANAHARQGHLLAYNAFKLGSDDIARQASLLGGEMDRFRVDDLYLLDVRAEKAFAARTDVDLTVSAELFNAFNAGTVLSREATLNTRLGDNVLDVVSPRIWKLGVRLSWR